MDKPRVSIIGVGKVGTAVGHLLRKKGYEIVAIAARHQESLEKALPYTGGLPTTNIVKAASLSKITFITTSDDQIEPVCQAIAQGGGFEAGNIVFHMSGALSREVLKSAREKGAVIGSIHPMQTFADVDGAIEQLPGSIFGVSADEAAIPTAKKIIEALEGEPVFVKDEDKPLYHAAACVVCNYFVTLVYYGEGLYRALGISKDKALKAFLPLLKGTIKNLERYGTAGALTGPIARGDVGTIKKHLQALERIVPDQADLYKLLGRYTVKVALEKGTINKAKAEELLRILES